MKEKASARHGGLVFYILQLNNINRRNADLLHQMHKTAEH